MVDRAFIDTNILVYLYSGDELDKREIANNVFGCYSEPVVSVPIINELCNVLLKKFSVPNIRGVVDEISKAAFVAKISENTVLKAIDLKEKYGFSFFDSFHVATALETTCSVFFSEDMQHGQKVGNLKVINPFCS